jgi:hypothetical protein
MCTDARVARTRQIDGACHGRETQRPTSSHAEGREHQLQSGGGVDCRVRSLPAGACLEVASQIGIPDDFILVVEIDHLRQPCHVLAHGNAAGR